MSWGEPWWLVLAVPVGFGLWRWRPPAGPLRVLRSVLMLATVVAMARPAVSVPRRGRTVVVVADRSLSMPDDGDRLHRETIARLEQAMGADQQLGVVSFGASAVAESLPGGSRFGGFTGEVDGNRSDLAAGISRALSMIPSHEPGRILVLSDGRWTGEDPARVAAMAGARRVAVDVVPESRSEADDLAVEAIDAPQVAVAGEAFLITAWIRSPRTQDVDYVLRRSGAVLASGRARLLGGRDRLVFRDRAGPAGTRSYTLDISAERDDPVPGNNHARAMVTVEGPARLLHVTDHDRSGVAALLSGAGLEVTTRRPADVEWSLSELAAFDGVVLEDVPASAVGSAGLATAAAWVRSGAGGLLMTGGRHAFGAGGYYRSALEPVLPVTMELRQEHRKLALATVVVLDRSGSMAVPVAGGRSKMDLANLAAAEVVRLLTPMDQVGVVAVDSLPHVIVPLDNVRNPDAIESSILSIDSMGGGIFIYEGLAAAAAMLAEAEAGTRHILLFADAADAEEPGRYRELLGHCRDAGISVSVIGLGSDRDTDAGLLREIAGLGGGMVDFTEDPRELPRLFAQDTFVVARSTVIEQPTTLRSAAGMVAMLGRALPDPPAVGGYNLCYLRSGAMAGIVTEDEYEAPVVAGWQVELGRVACVTAELDGELTGELAAWDRLDDLVAGLSRWVMGVDRALPGTMVATQAVDRGGLRVQLHLDPSAELGDAAAGARVSLVQGDSGSRATVTERQMRRVAVDMLEVELPLEAAGAAVATVHLRGGERLSLAPVCLPYSPELAPATAGRGEAELRRIASLSGGEVRLRPEEVWKEVGRGSRRLELAPWLYLLAVVALTLEVLDRRSGLITAAVGALRLPGLRAGRNRPVTTVTPAVTPEVSATIGPDEPGLAGVAADESPTATDDSHDGLLAALDEVRRRSGRRGSG